MDHSYEYYKYFYYVARYLNISKAAKVLATSQPNVTRAVKKLEASLGCILFVRTNNGVSLTEQGEILNRHVSEAFRLLDAGESEISASSKNTNRNISVGFPLSFSYTSPQFNIILPIRQFYTDYPDIHLSIVNKATPELISSVREGSLDIAVISSSHTQRLKEMAAHTILRFRDAIIAGNKYRGEFTGPLPLSHFLSYPVIGYVHGTETSELYDQYFAAQGHVFHTSIDVTNPDQALSFVQNNMGIGCVPEFVAVPAIKAGQVFSPEITDDLPQRTISIIRNKFSGSSTAALLEDYIIRYFR